LKLLVRRSAKWAAGHQRTHEELGFTCDPSPWEILRHLSRGEKYNFYVSLLIGDKKGEIFGRLDGQSLVANPLHGGTLVTDFHRTQSKDIPQEIEEA
jgi:hypothetical protein